MHQWTKLLYSHTHLFQSLSQFLVLLLKCVNVVVVLGVKSLLFLLVLCIQVLGLSRRVDFAAQQPAHRSSSCNFAPAALSVKLPEQWIEIMTKRGQNNQLRSSKSILQCTMDVSFHSIVHSSTCHNSPCTCFLLLLLHGVVMIQAVLWIVLVVASLLIVVGLCTGGSYQYWQ